MQGGAPNRVQRRLAAILAADVAGYSRLMGQDEAGTLARLKTLRGDLIDPKIAEHKGRIVKPTGDGLLIEFPSVVEAVACTGGLTGSAQPKPGAAWAAVLRPCPARCCGGMGLTRGRRDPDAGGYGMTDEAKLATIRTMFLQWLEG